MGSQLHWARHCHIATRTWAHRCHICAVTGLNLAHLEVFVGIHLFTPVAATSAPGLGSPLPHLRLSHTHTHMHAPTQTNAHTRTLTHARAGVRVHTHTPCRAAWSACPRRQPLSEFAAGGKCVCCNIPCCTLHVARCSTFQVVWFWCDRFLFGVTDSVSAPRNATSSGPTAKAVLARKP